MGGLRRCLGLVGGIQRIYDGGWDPSGESDNSKSEQARASQPLSGSRTLVCTGCTRSLPTLNTSCTDLSALLSTTSSFSCFVGPGERGEEGEERAAEEGDEREGNEK
jgi:hypothetical protein